MHRRRQDDGTLTTMQTAEAARVSYRQLDHWVGNGWLTIADRAPGSGSIRRWTPDDVLHARVFAELVHAGVLPSAAAEAMPSARIGSRGFVVELGGLDIIGTLP